MSGLGRTTPCFPLTCLVSVEVQCNENLRIAEKQDRQLLSAD